MNRTFALLVACAACAFLLGGCQSFTPTTVLNDESASMSSDQRNVFRLTPTEWQGTSQVPMSYTEIGGPDGVNTLNAANPGAAAINEKGIALSSPNPTKADTIEYEFAVVLRDENDAIVFDENGLPIVLKHSTTITGFESKPELVLAEIGDAIGVQVEALMRLYDTNRAQYEQQIEGLKATWGAVVEIIDAGIRAASPLP